MLQVDNVSFAYERTRRRGAIRVLDEVSLSVNRQAVVGLIGPNGTGKTTLLRIVAGRLKPLAGRVLVDGLDASRLTRHELARRIASVPQETQPVFDFTALDVVLMGRYPHLGAFELERPADLAIAREAMAATGTGALEARPFGSLSGGEKQRVVIASALAQEAPLLLLDEPTASLDLRYQVEISVLLRVANRTRGVTMDLSTHDLNLAAALCSELILLKQGRVMASGATERVLTPAAIRELYDVDAEIVRHRSGHLRVIPLVDSR